MNTPVTSLLMAAALSAGSAAHAQSINSDGLQPEIFTLTVRASVYAPSDVAMPVHVFKPRQPQAGVGASGPWPVVIFSHGRAGNLAGRAALKSPVHSYFEMVRYWQGKGYAVVAAIRPGYGENTAHDPEDHGARWRGNMCTGPVNYGKTAGAAAYAIRTVRDWVVTQGWANKDRMLLVGQSVGGLATVAACAQNWPGVIGCVNFVGGAGGNPEDSPGKSCLADQLGEELASHGKSTTVPSMWLYSANDKFWGEQAPKDWYRAYVAVAKAAGQKAPSEFFAAPAVGDNGHTLQGSGGKIWMPVLDSWLKANGF